MEQVVIFIGSVVFVFTILIELLVLIHDGWFINSRTERFIMGLNDSGVRVGCMYISVLYVKGKEVYIRKEFTIASKYYVSGLGRVPRWSKAHSKIEELYFNALTK